MNAQHIQAMIAVNAARISGFHFAIEDRKVQAGFDKSRGNDSWAAHEYKAADKLRSKMRQAVELQRAMKTELAGIHREARIERKHAQLAECGVYGVGDGMNYTSHEMEARLDALLTDFIPKKADTRTAA